jgi:hypothetical protein
LYNILGFKSYLTDVSAGVNTIGTLPLNPGTYTVTNVLLDSSGKPNSSIADLQMLNVTIEYRDNNDYIEEAPRDSYPETGGSTYDGDEVGSRGDEFVFLTDTNRTDTRLYFIYFNNSDFKSRFPKSELRVLCGAQSLVKLKKSP